MTAAWKTSRLNGELWWMDEEDRFERVLISN